jgi:hypothetical protein
MRINIRLGIVVVAVGLMAVGGSGVAAAQQPSQQNDSSMMTGRVDRYPTAGTSVSADTSGGRVTSPVLPADTSEYTPPQSDSGRYAPPDSGTYAPPRSDSGTYAPPKTPAASPPET